MQYQLSDLIDLKQSQRLLDNFCDTAGVAAAIIDPKGQVLIASHWQNICVDYHRLSEKSITRCIEAESQVAIKLLQGKNLSVCSCRNGLTHAAAPIVIEGECVANICVGQFLLDNPDIPFSLRQAAELGFDEAAGIEFLSKVPIVTEASFPAVLAFLSACAQMIANLGGKRIELLECKKKLEQSRRKNSELRAMREEVLEDSQSRSLLENMPFGFAYCKMILQRSRPKDFLYLNVNRAFEEMTGSRNAIGRKATEVFPLTSKSSPESLEIYGRVASTGAPESFEIYLEEQDIWLSVSVYSTKKGYFAAVFRDITAGRTTQEGLERINRELEKRAGEWALEMQTKEKKLYEVNTALKVLLGQREEDRKELEEAIADNLKSLVFPYTEKLKTTHLTESQRTYLSILESNVGGMASSLAGKLRIQHINLTPTEMQVATLVRDGKSTKEIADILRVSAKAISFHRDNIRRKLDLKNKKENLRTHLEYLN
jgi:DNA-binding CsgD family transcriptional regulator/ligand-binding sensor protein